MLTAWYVFLIRRTHPPPTGATVQWKTNDVAEKFCRNLCCIVGKCSVWRAGEACEQERPGSEALQSQDVEVCLHVRTQTHPPRGGMRTPGSTAHTAAASQHIFAHSSQALQPLWEMGVT